MPHSPEVFLLVTAEADLTLGLALAKRIVLNSNWTAMILVVSDTPAPLMELARTRLATLESEHQSRFQVASQGTDLPALIAHVEHQSQLVVLLIPGLEQLNDNRKQLMRQVGAHVVCFEAHPGLQLEPTSLSQLGEDHAGAAAWLSKQLCVTCELQSLTLEELSAAGKAAVAAADASSPSPAQHSEADWVVLATTSDGVDTAGRTAKAAIEAAVGPVFLVRAETSWLQWFSKRYLPATFARLAPPMTREARRALAQDLTMHSALSFEFIALICASTFLASFGLVQDSAAVIIGAMLIAPLMTPILGAGLSLSQGNRPLFFSSLRTIGLGFLAALTTSACFGLLVRLTTTTIFQRDETHAIVLTPEIWSRTSPTIIDFLVGLVGGSAAAFARTRSHLSAALAGAAIAAALVPPIATAGIQISLLSESIAPQDASRGLGNLVYGPILLFAANMLTIMIGSSFVLWFSGVRGEHAHSSKERWAARTTVLLMTLTAVIAVWITQRTS